MIFHPHDRSYRCPDRPSKLLAKDHTIRSVAPNLSTLLSRSSLFQAGQTAPIEIPAWPRNVANFDTPAMQMGTRKNQETSHRADATRPLLPPHRPDTPLCTYQRLGRDTALRESY